VIEDNLAVRENIEEILTLAGYNVLGCSNGLDGVRQINTFNPHLILCDIMMPELDGYGVLKILNTNPSWSQIPVIVLTAKAEKIDFRKGMSLGASDYITKPFDDEDLLASIEIRLKRGEQSYGQSSSSSLRSLDTIPHDYISKIITEVCAECELRKFENRAIVINEGQNPRYVYYMVKGKTRVIRKNDLGKEFTHRIVVEKEYFGAIDMINHRNYTKTVQCIEDSEILLIPIKDFMNLVLNNHEFALAILRNTTSEVTILENKLIDQAYSSVRKKIANALVDLHRIYPNDIGFYCSREDLASMAGTAKETTIRTLSDFKTDGLIEIIDNNIKILNLNHLANLNQ
jgi:CRP/FNR family transcriptional regulator, polysaccharide utilization system transcription regulator